MTKKLLALAMIAALSACSSSNDDSSSAPPAGSDGQAGEGSNPDSNTPDEGGNTPPVSNPSTTVAGEGGPPAGARAGTYVGNFGQGDGIYILDNVNNLVGLAQNSDGSARSVFGNLGEGISYMGGLNEYVHVASSPPAEGVFSAGEGIASDASPTYNLNIVDGQTIEGNGVNLVAASAGAVSPANTDTLAGSWIGRHQFTGADAPVQLVTELTFSGTGVSGLTRLENTADEFRNAIEGTLTAFGDVSLVSYTWAGNTYNGAVFFLPNGGGDIVFLGETANVDADNRTIASRLTRQ